ncbi:MAG: crossover junction endodeoxyribonuclease RuvC [Desulfobulbus sp.]|jgi:crossover junction endodeoxyribonuclease RuvC
MRILGIDPGARVTGYGVVAVRGREIGFVACGTIRTGPETVFSRRLHTIFEDLCAVILRHQPTVAAMEEVFVARNPRSALKLGQARGAAAVAVLQHGLDLFDYPARQVKQAVTGYGQAEKVQVQHMVRALLDLDSTPSPDAADALAVALCHAHHAALYRRCGV